MSNPTAQSEIDRLFSRLPVALYRTSVDGRILAANHAAATLLGFDTVEDLLEVTDIAEQCYIDPQRRFDWQAAVETAGVIRDFKVQLRRPNGEQIWARDTGRAITDEDGHVRFYEGILTDITAEVEAESSSLVLAGVLDATSDLVVVFDETGQLRYANEASRAFLGLAPQQAQSRPHFAAIFPEIKWDSVFNSIDTRGWSGELVLRDSAGRPCPLWVVVTVHHDTDGRRYISGTARDLTLMKRTQQRLEELVSAKDDFVATVSHELRHPLTGVMGLAGELRDHFEEFGVQERRDLITLIAQESAEMMWLVDDLLVASRADGGEFAVVVETMDVVTNLQEVSRALEEELVWDLPDTSLTATADPQRFRQIVRNLLSNAQRHGGGDIRISAHLEEGTVVVSVSDGGDGVDDAEVERIFDPYHRAAGVPLKPGSLGLGLSVARRLARLMKGDLTYSRIDGRTYFRLSVPASDSLALPQS